MNQIAKNLMKVFCLMGKRAMHPAAMDRPIRLNKNLLMKCFLSRYLRFEQEVCGQAMMTFSQLRPVSNTHIIYLHGGAYVWQGACVHWQFIKELLRGLKQKVTYVDYPLAPEHTYQNTFKMLQEGFDRLTRQYPHDQFVLMGDSSGGGLALAFAQKLCKEKHPVQPREIILLSPWLDVTMSNPDIEKIEPADCILTRRGLEAAADRYAGGADKSIYLLSPINGSIKGLAHISIFTGTDDILWPDCRRFADKAKAEGGKISLMEYPGMPHTFMLFPLPQAGQVRHKIAEILLN